MVIELSSSTLVVVLKSLLPLPPLSSVLMRRFVYFLLWQAMESLITGTCDACGDLRCLLFWRSSLLKFVDSSFHIRLFKTLGFIEASKYYRLLDTQTGVLLCNYVLIKNLRMMIDYGYCTFVQNTGGFWRSIFCLPRDQEVGQLSITWHSSWDFLSRLGVMYDMLFSPTLLNDKSCDRES